MSFDVVIGRTKKDYEKFKTSGSIYLGKQYVQMGTVTSLSNNVYLDVSGAHVVFVCGKRGGGKSYSMGVIAEGVASLPIEVRHNLSVILLDTMGVYWTMKYPNHQDAQLLREWGLDPEGLDVKIFTPAGFFDKYKEKGIPTDKPFALRPADLNTEDWCLTFGLDVNSEPAVFISQVVNKSSKLQDYGISDMIKVARSDKTATNHVKNLIVSYFERVSSWGIFSNTGTSLKKLAAPGQVTVLDVSPYATLPGGWQIKSLVIGLLSKKLFNERMIARKNEEYAKIDSATHYFSKDDVKSLQDPLVWLVIDEAHEMLPSKGKTAASDSLITLLREGRQPGISLILATQQPGKIHTDVITQSDIVLSHRLTAQIDTKALEQLNQSYMYEGIVKKLETLPSEKGSAIVFDDQNERIFPIKVRPRLTWHGGSSPSALLQKKHLFEN